MLSSANLRYRLRTLEQLRSRQRPTATLVLTHSDQATRRAFRTLGNPMEHRSTFVATEGELLAGDAGSPVWQQCGNGDNSFLPEAVNPDVSLDAIMGWLRRRARHATGDRPRPDPEGAVSQPPTGDDAPAHGAGEQLPGGQTQPKRETGAGPAGPPGPCAPRTSWPG